MDEETTALIEMPPPGRYPTCDEFGLRFLDAKGRRATLYDDWFVLGEFGLRLSDRCNGWFIFDKLKAIFGEQSVVWTKGKNDHVWIMVEPDCIGALRLADRYFARLETEYVLDPDLYHQKVAEGAGVMWQRLSLPERLKILKDAELPASLVRKADVPDPLREAFQEHIVETHDPEEEPGGISMFSIGNDADGKPIIGLHVRF